MSDQNLFGERRLTRDTALAMGVRFEQILTDYIDARDKHYETPDEALTATTVVKDSAVEFMRQLQRDIPW